MVTDPPYNVNYEGSAGKIKNDNLENEKFYQFLFDAFTCMEKSMANDASIYVFHADTEGLNFRNLYLEEAVACSRSLAVSVAARAVLVRLEEARQAPVVLRPQADDNMGVRQAKEERRPPNNEAHSAYCLSDKEFKHEQLYSSRPLRRLGEYAYRL